MDINSYLEKIICPIDKSSPVGLKVIDDPVLEFVESQIMKIGSLSHGDVQWIETEKAVLSLLQHKTKDIKLLTYLLQCLQQQPSIERFILSFQILIEFIDLYWEEAFPAPGKRGTLPRRKFFSQMMQRTVISAEKLISNGITADETQKKSLESLFQRALVIVAKKKLTLELVEQLSLIVKQKILEAEVKQITILPSSVASISTTQSVSSFSRGNDKETKQNLLNVSDFLLDSELGMALGLRLRRYTLWFSITALPDSDNNKHTQLMPITSDRVTEYQHLLQVSPDLPLLLRIEQSISLSPYWLDGHFLSYQLALKLKQDEWANAIKSEVLQFLSRFPTLIDYSFKGGVAFASTETQAWLFSSENLPNAGIQEEGNWQEKRNIALALANESGVSTALAMLNEGLAKAKEPRDQFYWRLLSADIMAAFELGALAQQQYKTLKELAQKTKLVDWEPSLICHLDNTISKVNQRK